MSILEVSGLRKVYTSRLGGSRVEALRNVSFTVEQGEYVAIMGESGSGKTTLLNILAALDEPTAGLDPAGRENLMANIRDYHRNKGKTIILVSHSMDDCARLATRMIVMSKGELVLTDTPRNVFRQADLMRSIGLGVPQAAELTHALIAEGFDLPGDLYTLDEVCHAILALKKEGRAC